MVDFKDLERRIELGLDSLSVKSDVSKNDLVRFLAFHEGITRAANRADNSESATHLAGELVDEFDLDYCIINSRNGEDFIPVVQIGSPGNYFTQLFNLSHRGNDYGHAVVARVGDFSEIELIRMALVFRHYSSTLHMSNYIKDLQKLAVTDELTGLFNRRKFNFDLASALDDAERSGNPTSIVVLDIDFFKQVNDVYGHDHGDNILRQVSYLLKENMRINDAIYRIGGEEFVVICPNTSDEEAAVLGKRLVDLVNQTKFFHSLDVKKAEINYAPERPVDFVTISAGTSSGEYSGGITV